MRSIKEIRRDNLQRLAKEFGSQTALAEATGVSAGYISHLLNKRKDGTYVKNLGDNLAQKIEEQLNLNQGWLDINRMKNKDKQEENELDRLEKELDPLSMIISNMSKKMSETNKLKVIEIMREKIELQNYRQMMNK